MEIEQQISGIFGRLRHYLLGRGLLSFGIMAASWIGAATSIGLWPAAAIAGIGAIALTTFTRLSQQHDYEDQMLNLYRREIAEELGRAPQQLTRDDLRTAAKSNEVLAQALARQEHKTAISIATQSLAAVVTVAAVGFGEAVPFLREALGSVLGPIAHFIGVGTVAGFSSLIAHDGLAMAIGQATGVSKAAAHDRILDMQHGLEQGIAVTPEQVYGALVAGEPPLRRTIEQQFHMPYARMQPWQQQAVLQRIGVADAMQSLATQINDGKVYPGKLAYMMGEEHHSRRIARMTEVAHIHEPARQSFVARYAPEPRAQTSYREQVETSRAATAEQLPPR